MNEGDMAVTRRTVFVAGGLGALAIASLSGPAAAADLNAAEKANVQLVKDFCQAWGEDPPDSENIVNRFMSEDCLVRFGETIEPVSGQSGAIALFQTFLNNGERYDLKIIDTFARGPVVVNSRIDSKIKGEKTTNPTPVVGVFIVKDGKIKEWSDYA